MSEEELRAGLFGDIDYSRLTAAVAFVKSGEHLTESETLHVQFEEKSGTPGALALRINYI